MLQKLGDGVNRRLFRLFPERRLILRSETSTRYLRASPMMQASAAALMAGFVCWTGFASIKLAETAWRASSATERLAVIESAYEARIARLTEESETATAALANAETVAERALDQLSREHDSLTKTMTNERELASRLHSERTRLANLAEEHDAAITQMETAESRVVTLQTALEDKSREAESRGDMLVALNETLGDVATARNDAAQTAHSLTLKIDELSAEISERDARQDLLLTRLESAAALSLDSLEDVFEKSGVKLEPILDQVRREDGGAGGPFLPADEAEALGADAATGPRLTALMENLERVKLLRIAADRLPFGRPVAGSRLTSGFGYRHDPINRRGAKHTGIDYAGKRGTRIEATAAGRVSYVGWRRGYGKVVEIEHAFGYETVYAHLSKTRVKVGAHVERGDRIGDMGNTGRSTGTHLHYEVRIGGVPVNPAKYIEAVNHVL